MNFFRKINIFTVLPVIFVFAGMLRMFDVAHFATPTSIAESTPPAKEFGKIQEHAPATTTPATGAPETGEAGKPADPKAAALPVITDTTVPEGPLYGERAFTATEVEVLQSLSKRRDELDKREQQMGQREALLKAAGGEVDRKIAELNKIRHELEDLLNKQQTVQDERITSLVKIYEGMKPKEAARIFDTLEMDILLSVISKMSERKSSPVLANMNPERAREVTIQLAEQRRLPGVSDAKKDKSAKDATPATPITPAQP